MTRYTEITVKRQKTKNWKKLLRHIKLVFWPHAANRHHPHVVRWYGLAVVVVSVVAMQGLYNLSTTGMVLGTKTDLATEKLLTATNNERVKQGLPALVLNEKLSHAAYLKAEDMLADQYWAHVAPDGKTPWDWVTTAGYSYDYAGENLARNFSTAEGVTVAWMDSPAHRANVLGDKFSEVGFAVVEGELEHESATIVVALYGHRASDGVPLGTTSAPIDQPLAPITRLGVAIQSLTPAAIGSVVVILAIAAVALAAHVYRRKLPRSMQRSWRRHHGVIKAAGLISLCIVLLVLYSGGQI